MRIAVIGATGLLGQHTARAVLENGHELVVVHRPGSNLRRLTGLAFQAAEADVADKAALTKALKRADAVIHCAGYYPRLPLSLKQEILQACAQMESFCAACVQSGCKKVVYVGAASTLRKNPSHEPADETFAYDLKPADRNPFLQVKWAMERIALEYARQGRLALVIGIPSMAFGEYDFGPTAGRLILGIASRSLSGYVRANRNVLYAGDVGRGLVRCLESGRPSERYLLAGENITMDDLVSLISRKAGVKPPKPVPVGAALAFARIQALRYRLGGKPPSVTTTAIKVLAGGQFLNSEKAYRELGFRPTRTCEKAIELALGWFRANGYLDGATHQFNAGGSLV